MENRQATWIWYPGDFEVWLGNIFNNRRTERGALFPPFWKQDSHWPTVEFTTNVELEADETIHVCAEGKWNIAVDGQLRPAKSVLTIPKGRHTLGFKVWNQATPPALFVEGTTVVSDASWTTTYEDKIWIDENGVAHGSGTYVPVGSWNFNRCDTPPSLYHLEYKEQSPVGKEQVADGVLYDFGRETFGCLKLFGLQGTAYIYYGESREEALDKEHCETLDVLDLDNNCQRTDGGQSVCRLDSKAFRFVYIEMTDGARCDDVTMDFEYAPFEEAKSGLFRCSDDEMNRIWLVSAYTLELTTREFFMDGIKRDRWTWSGDAIQSYLMNYYLHFDSECVKRTIRQLRGKDPVTAHVNTIMDYTFYWFKSVHDYYLYTDDIDFVREIYPRMLTLMDYCLTRLNSDGMAEGQADDWIFVDWVDFPMHKRGTLCFEQILFFKALETLARCATLLHDHPAANAPKGSIAQEKYADDAKRYSEMAERLRRSTQEMFWNEEAHAFMHAVEDGKMNTMVTKFPNMFAIIYGFATVQQKQDILHHVLLNDLVDAITTPYMRFYELEALCEMGLQDSVLQYMKAYWGGMLREGATTFWEKYNPEESGKQHLAMYGRPYGKSLCHAWGASPLYIIGKYFLGVRPTTAGYASYEIRPTLGGLQWMEGEVPTPFGKIHIRMDRDSITVHSDGGKGRLFLNNRTEEIPAHQEMTFKLR